MHGEVGDSTGSRSPGCGDAAVDAGHFGASGRFLVQVWCIDCRPGAGTEVSVDDFVSTNSLKGGLANKLHVNEASWPDVT